MMVRPGSRGGLGWSNWSSKVPQSVSPHWNRFRRRLDRPNGVPKRALWGPFGPIWPLWPYDWGSKKVTFWGQKLMIRPGSRDGLGWSNWSSEVPQSVSPFWNRFRTRLDRPNGVPKRALGGPIGPIWPYGRPQLGVKKVTFWGQKLMVRPGSRGGLGWSNWSSKVPQSVSPHWNRIRTRLDRPNGVPKRALWGPFGPIWPYDRPQLGVKKVTF